MNLTRNSTRIAIGPTDNNLDFGTTSVYGSPLDNPVPQRAVQSPQASSEQKKCWACKGNGHVTFKMKDLSGKSGGQYLRGIGVCPACQGKGFIDPSDAGRAQSVEQYDQIES